jgi:hypothetical protein
VSATLKTVWLRVSKYKPENFLSAHFNSPAIHEFFAEMAKSAQNFAGQPFFELFGEVFSNVTLRLVSRNPSGGTGFRLVNAPRMTAGGKRRMSFSTCLICCAGNTAHSQEWRG